MASATPARYPGVIAIGAGALTAALIYRNPELLRVPAWVAYAACGAFVLAGLALIAQSASNASAYRWLVVALIACMLVPPLWAAFGAPSQSCSAAILGMQFVPPDALCRGVWMFAAGLIIVIFMVALRWALRRSGPD